MKNNKKLKILGNIVFYIILISLLSISFTLIKYKKEGTQPSIMGNKFFSVLTGSMEPTIMTGDLIITKQVKPQQIKVGDIITFASPNSNNITTHRVIEVINENEDIKYITKGDANNTKDPSPVEDEMLIGKVEKCIPKLGQIILWIKSKLSLILVTIILIILFGNVLKSLIYKLKIMDRKK